MDNEMKSVSVAHGSTAMAASKKPRKSHDGIQNENIDISWLEN